MNRTFPSELFRLAGKSPDKSSIYFLEAGAEDRRISYRELYHQASVFAESLGRTGILPGEVVVLIIDYKLELLTGFWGAVLQGAIPAILPFLTEKLNPERYLADLESLISVTRPAAIITYHDFKDIVETAAHPGSSVRSILYLEDLDLEKANSEADLSSDYPGFDRDPADIVLLQHSSGTTGLQKGVALSHTAVFNQLDALRAAIQLDTENDVVVSWLPLYHDMGLIAGFIMPILTGIPLALMSPFDWVRAPYRMFEAVTRYHGTLTRLPNFAYNFCARKIRSRQLEGIDLSSWRGVINCSEPVRWESHQAFYEKFQEYGLDLEALQTSYAMAENTFGVTQSKLGSVPRTQHIDAVTFQKQGRIEPAPDGKPALVMMSSGVPLSNTRIRVLDPDGRELPDNVIGEICLKSNSMLSEYYRRPEVTESSFKDGWFLTGDYGYLAGGEIYVTGRKKDLIIVGGKNIYPSDLEELIYEVEGVHPGRAVVFGVFNDQLGTEDVVVVAESDDENTQSRQDLADRVRSYITQNSPVSLRYVEIVDSQWILKTSSGKVSRSANREKYLAEKGLL
ncbi:MAG: AMP-binding protein [Anaerolineales bacterium]